MTRAIRAEILDLLSRREQGTLDERSVHEQAEELWDRYTGPRDVPETHADSLVVEALSQLEVLNHQLITAQDVPAFRQLLSATSGKELDAWEEWREYWASVDMERRKQVLMENPYHGT